MCTSEIWSSNLIKKASSNSNIFRNILIIFIVHFFSNGSMSIDPQKLANHKKQPPPPKVEKQQDMYINGDVNITTNIHIHNSK